MFSTSFFFFFYPVYVSLTTYELATTIFSLHDYLWGNIFALLGLYVMCSLCTVYIVFSRSIQIEQFNKVSLNISLGGQKIVSYKSIHFIYMRH